MFGTCKGCHELAQDVEQLKNQLNELQRQVAQSEGAPLDERMDVLEKHVDEISFEWDKWYKKYRSLWANMARGRDQEAEVEAINPAAAALFSRGA